MARSSESGGLVGLADQDEGLAQIIGRQSVVLSLLLGLAQCRDRRRVAAALGLEQPEQKPGDAITRVVRCSIRVRLDQGVERPAVLDVVSVDAVECRSAPGRLRTTAKPLHHQPLAVVISLICPPRRHTRQGDSEGEQTPGHDQPAEQGRVGVPHRGGLRGLCEAGGRGLGLPAKAFQGGARPGLKSSGDLLEIIASQVADVGHQSP